MSAPPDPPEAQSRPRRRLRGELFWHDAGDAIFLLDRQHRLVYANPAWERLTAIALADIRGRVCRRRGPGNDVLERTLTALAPPVELSQGRGCLARRRAPQKPHAYWEIEFFPWSGAGGDHSILGKVREIADPKSSPALLPEKLVQLREALQRDHGPSAWQSDLPIMQRLVEQLRLAAATSAPALLVGPPGSGKGWAARAIHQQSAQRSLHFARFDARLPPALLAEMLTASQGWRIGTLLVAHVELLPREAQALLVERLGAGHSEPRLLASTTEDPDSLARDGRLLPELHYRLSTLTIPLPALRDRLADMPLLIRDMLPRAVEAAGATTNRNVTAAARECLLRHHWPDNMRELYEVLVQACRRARGEQIDVGDLPLYLQGAPPPAETSLPLDDILTKVERRLLALAIELSRGNKTTAAAFLGIWRQRLMRRLEQLGLEKGEAAGGDEAREAPTPNESPES